MKGQRWIVWSGLFLLSGLPVLAQPANFGNLTLGNGKMSGMLVGTTGGTTSLPAVVSNRDRSGNSCPGFGDPTPDHVLDLQQPVSKLTLTVASGTDTTLIISGPGGVRCADDSSSGKDAQLEDTDFQKGTYQIWVGTMEPNTKRDYRLSVQAN